MKFSDAFIQSNLQFEENSSFSVNIIKLVFFTWVSLASVNTTHCTVEHFFGRIFADVCLQMKKPLSLLHRPTCSLPPVRILCFISATFLPPLCSDDGQVWFGLNSLGFSVSPLHFLPERDTDTMRYCASSDSRLIGQTADSFCLHVWR